jgi:hypothetical protein
MPRPEFPPAPERHEQSRFRVLVGIVLLSTWATAGLSFQASPDGGTTWAKLLPLPARRIPSAARHLLFHIALLDAGRSVVEELRRRFPGWPVDHFEHFPAPYFEAYYPGEFGKRGAAAVGLPHGEARQRAKVSLVVELVARLREDPERGRSALQQSAQDVIERLRAIERVVTNA